MNKNQPRFKVLGETRTNEKVGRNEAELTNRPPIQCWGYGGPHYVKNCPHCKGANQISQIQEASIVGEVARSILKINAALEDHHVEFQPTMVEFEGIILTKVVLF